MATQTKSCGMIRISPWQRDNDTYKATLTVAVGSGRTASRKALCRIPWWQRQNAWTSRIPFFRKVFKLPQAIEERMRETVEWAAACCLAEACGWLSYEAREKKPKEDMPIFWAYSEAWPSHPFRIYSMTDLPLELDIYADHNDPRIRTRAVSELTRKLYPLRTSSN